MTSRITQAAGALGPQLLETSSWPFRGPSGAVVHQTTNPPSDQGWSLPRSFCMSGQGSHTQVGTDAQHTESYSIPAGPSPLVPHHLSSHGERIRTPQPRGAPERSAHCTPASGYTPLAPPYSLGNKYLSTTTSSFVVDRPLVYIITCISQEATRTKDNRGRMGAQSHSSLLGWKPAFRKCRRLRTRKPAGFLHTPLFSHNSGWPRS